MIHLSNSIQSSLDLGFGPENQQRAVLRNWFLRAVKLEAQVRETQGSKTMSELGVQREKALREILHRVLHPVQWRRLLALNESVSEPLEKTVSDAMDVALKHYGKMEADKEYRQEMADACVVEGDGGPAFPGPSGFLECYEAGKPETVETTQIPKKPFPGMTLRDYACIQLRAPQTGKEWLDEIIRQSQLNEFAGQALPGFLAIRANDAANTAISEMAAEDGSGPQHIMARLAHGQADAMQKELAGG